MGKSKARTLLNFRMNLAKQMIGQFQITRKRKRISNIRQLFALSALFSSPLDFLHIWGEVLSMEGSCGWI
jgi:hypothetical protein